MVAGFDMPTVKKKFQQRSEWPPEWHAVVSLSRGFTPDQAANSSGLPLVVVEAIASGYGSAELRNVSRKILDGRDPEIPIPFPVPQVASEEPDAQEEPPPETSPDPVPEVVAQPDVPEVAEVDDLPVVADAVEVEPEPTASDPVEEETLPEDLPSPAPEQALPKPRRKPPTPPAPLPEVVVVPGGVTARLGNLQVAQVRLTVPLMEVATVDGESAVVSEATVTIAVDPVEVAAALRAGVAQVPVTAFVASPRVPESAEVRLLVGRMLEEMRGVSCLCGHEHVGGPCRPACGCRSNRVVSA